MSGPTRAGEHVRNAHVVIAVKDLAAAKSRLADSFDPSDRVRLVLSMLRDTMGAASEVSAVQSITVVTPDREVRAVALSLGARVVGEPNTAERSNSEERLNHAFGAAAALVRGEDGDNVDIIALQADLPALRADELAEAYDTAFSGGRSVVVDHHGTGTAALISKGTAEQFVPLFGPASATRHTEAGARRLGGYWPGLRLDVDTIDDVRAAYSLGVGPATTELLTELGWQPSF